MSYVGDASGPFSPRLSPGRPYVSTMGLMLCRLPVVGLYIFGPRVLTWASMSSMPLHVFWPTRPIIWCALHHRIMSIIVPWLPRPLQWSPYPPGSISVLEHELSIFPRCAHVVDKATQLGAQQDHPKLGRILGNVERIHGLLWMGWIKNSN